eukprot:1160890-Pelagomonas_calceolata.AAC.7
MSATGDDAASPPPPSAEQQPSSSLPPAPPEPAGLREDMLQNAVAFLTHPKVKDSPEATKRSFLDRKGLTTAEVDEAFRRVPPPSQQQVTPSPPAVPVTSGPSGLVTYQQQPQNPQQQGALVAQPPPGWSERTKAQREAQEQQQRALSELVVTLNACKRICVNFGLAHRPPQTPLPVLLPQ